MTSYLIDTNHASAIMGGERRIAEQLLLRTREGDRFAISVTVLSELYFAAYASKRQQNNMHNIRTFLSHIPILPFDVPAAEEYGRIRAELKAKGRPIPSTDAQIAAVARIHRLIVLSADRHFQYVENLTAQNWL